MIEIVAVDQMGVRIEPRHTLCHSDSAGNPRELDLTAINLGDNENETVY